MRETTIVLDGTRFPLYAVNTLVVGSGAAALNAAVCLHDRGQRDVLIATEAWGGGTSANAGSDKQTYCKVATVGDPPDSPALMAADLAAGGCMHGDIALCEAQHSLQAFHHLVQLGVPFPHETYGGFVGYRTDHDPRGRGTSAGPLTSRLMVEALAREVERKQIRILDRHQVVALLVNRREGEPKVAGAMALVGGDAGGKAPHFVLFNASNVVLATGGPGGMYADSVYPPQQTGSIGLALQAGAIAQNLTESQFGLASIAFRWNLSGSYQQVIPRYVSTDAEGRDEREFLTDAFPDIATLAGAIFRKGYEWPFDARRIEGCGSSLIDLLVYRERVGRGRRVFLDYTRNPAGDERLGRFSLEALDTEARRYLEDCGALQPTPIERLRRMNPPAIDVYGSRGIDLGRDRLEIAVCAQHNNGGLTGNHWWESNVRGLFPVGEVNGAHGVYRSGGAALNAGQVGGLRAAMYIARRRGGAPPADDVFLEACGEQVRQTLAIGRRATDAPAPEQPGAPASERLCAEAVRLAIQERMSRTGALIRSQAVVRQAIGEAWALYEQARQRQWAREPSELPAIFRNVDLALAHAVYLEAIGEYLARGGQSRGSCLVVNPEGDVTCDALGAEWRFSLNAPGAFVDQHILEVSIDPDAASGKNVRKQWVKVRPIPVPDIWFETVWKAFRENEVIR